MSRVGKLAPEVNRYVQSIRHSSFSYALSSASPEAEKSMILPPSLEPAGHRDGSPLDRTRRQASFSSQIAAVIRFTDRICVLFYFITELYS